MRHATRRWLPIKKRQNNTRGGTVYDKDQFRKEQDVRLTEKRHRDQQNIAQTSTKTNNGAQNGDLRQRIGQTKSSKRSKEMHLTLFLICLIAHDSDHVFRHLLFNNREKFFRMNCTFSDKYSKTPHCSILCSAAKWLALKDREWIWIFKCPISMCPRSSYLFGLNT